jgi:hypothetical protein
MAPLVQAAVCRRCLATSAASIVSFIACCNTSVAGICEVGPRVRQRAEFAAPSRMGDARSGSRQFAAAAQYAMQATELRLVLSGRHNTDALVALAPDQIAPTPAVTSASCELPIIIT